MMTMIRPCRAIDYNLDGPVLGEHELVSYADFANKTARQK